MKMCAQPWPSVKVHRGTINHGAWSPLKATISSIADSSGLSTATVDRVINGRPGVSAANRQRVMEAAQQLGYLPTAGAVDASVAPGPSGVLSADRRERLHGRPRAAS